MIFKGWWYRCESVRYLTLMKRSCSSSEMSNRVELHPWCQQRDIVDYCNKEGILVQAYSPLTQGKKLNDPTLLEVARKVRLDLVWMLIQADTLP